MATIALVARNTAPNLRVFLTNAAGAQDLTGAEVVPRITNQNTSLVQTLDCDVVVPYTDGEILVHAPEDGWPEGDWLIEYDVTYANAAVQTFPNRAEDIDLLLIRPASEPAA